MSFGSDFLQKPREGHGDPGSDAEAEYEFFRMAFNIIGTHLEEYAEIEDKFCDLYDAEVERKRVAGQKDLDGVRGIPWHQLPPHKWSGKRDGYDAMMKSLPGILEKTMLQAGSFDELQELRELACKAHK